MAQRTEQQRRQSALERQRRQSLERARTAKRESRYLDFKEEFDPSSSASWCELVKDLAAIANSGGGVIVIGVRNNGRPSRANLSPILDLDPAKITDQVFRFTSEHFSGFEIGEVKRGRAKAALIIIDPIEIPLVFSKPGTYPIADNKQKTAFSRGTLYVRHGAKSEPALTSDLARIVERHREEVRATLLRDLRRVVEASAGEEVALLRRARVDETGKPMTIQVTTDPGAPVYGRLSPDQTHPYRQTEAVAKVNERLAGTQINQFNVQSVRAVHDLNEKSAPDFVHQPKFGSRQYSDAFVEWLVDQIEADASFLEDARRRYYKMQRSR
ncbi:MAG: putative DNA binding domain-containing protein [Solirubrobacterales bacterium]